MATLITVGGNDWQRRCDAKCYDAKGPDCDCVCGGMNHGKGLETAQRNTAERAEELIGEVRAWEKFTALKVESNSLTQGELFDGSH